MLQQGTPQFAPYQLLDAARRAETEGRFDLAVEFYRHLADQFAGTAEAAEARTALTRVGPGWPPSNGQHPHATYLDVENGRATTMRSARRLKYPAPRNHYRLGTLLARLFTLAGWCTVLLGIGIAPLGFLTPILVPYGLPVVIGAAAGLVLLGFATLASGQVARALFDQANATRELLAIERARANGVG